LLAKSTVWKAKSEVRLANRDVALK
jgi:hypothetical protein